jgi:hypothetical protein
MVILWFRNCKEVYLELCRYLSSPKFKETSKKKRLNRGKDPKHRYSADGHVYNSQHIVRFCGSSAMYMYVVMGLTLDYRPSGMAL